MMKKGSYNDIILLYTKANSKMNTNSLAKKFISFYNKKGYKSKASSSLIHNLFPMSFNMSAGLVQLDPLIRSKVIINEKISVIQKCFRYFDLDKIGDNTHLSFFEMAGAFEVGKYDKAQLLSNLVNFLSDLGFNKQDLHVTVFGGGTIYNKTLSKDVDVYKIWESLLEKNNIHYGSIDTNFWIQKSSGEIALESKLCGTTTEIFYDLKIPTDHECNPFCSCGRYIEISNNLFISYEIIQELQINNLLNPAFESVFGLERLVMALNNSDSIFTDDKFTILFKHLPELNEKDFRVLSDHLVALCFLISDGAPEPGRNGRARIIRTLIRELLTIIYDYELPNDKLVQLISNIIEYYSPRYNFDEQKIVSMIFNHEVVYKKSIEKAKRELLKWIEKNPNITIPFSKFKLDYGLPERLSKKFLDEQRIKY